MKESIIASLEEALKELKITYNGMVKLEIPKKKENGDYATNIALELSKVLHKNPMEIAQMLIEKIQNKEIEKAEIAKPGFINFFVSKNYLLENINTVLKEKENYGRCNIGAGKKINIEFVSANPTGILHLGNARGGAYGDSLARILKFAGFDVTKEYYINDAGNQINNLALSIQARYFEICGLESHLPENGYHGPEITEIAKTIYEEFKDTQIQQNLEYYKKLGNKILLEKIINVLKEYRIEYDVFTSEQKIRDEYSLEDIITKLKESGYAYELDGAVWFKSTEFGDEKDHVLIKADGSFTYVVPDIAYHMNKMDRGFDKIIDVLGTDHHGYLPRLKGCVHAVGYDDTKINFKLLQLVRLMHDGEEVKMSKRTGNTVTLKELIDEVGINAARYFFSMRSLDTQMDFDMDLAKKKSNENPVYYVSYAYARICTILDSYEERKEKNEYVTLRNEDAYNVLACVYKWPEVVKNAATKEIPHLITNYVYELASVFHNFYSKYRIVVEDKERTEENLNLIAAVGQTIYNALELIGVEPPKKM